jgi:hypothetical protein
MCTTDRLITTIALPFFPISFTGLVLLKSLLRTEKRKQKNKKRGLGHA